MQEHLSMQPANQLATLACTHSKAEGRRSLILNLKFNVIKCLRLVSQESHAFVQAVDKIGIYCRSAEI